MGYNYFGCIPLRARWSLRGAGCPGVRPLGAPFPSLAHFDSCSATPQQRTGSGAGSAQKSAASPYQSPPPAPAAASHRGCGALRSLPLSRWSFHRSLWALRPDAPPRPALYPRAYSRFCEAAAPPPTGRHASRWSASRPYQSHRPGPPPLSRPASPNTPSDTRNPQKHRQRAASLPLVGQPPLPQTHSPAHLISGRAAGLCFVPQLAGSPSLHSAGLSLSLRGYQRLK